MVYTYKLTIKLLKTEMIYNEIISWTEKSPFGLCQEENVAFTFHVFKNSTYFTLHKAKVGGTDYGRFNVNENFIKLVSYIKIDLI